MAKSQKKPSRKDLKRDEVAEGIEEFITTTRKNAVKIVAFAAAVILVVAVTFAFNANRQAIKHDTSQILNSANILYEEISNIEDDAVRRQRMEGTVSSLDELIAQYSDSRAAHFALYLKGNCYFYMDELESAREAFQSYTDDAKTDIDRARGKIALGNTAENRFFLDESEQSQLDMAVALYGEAVELAPEGSYIYYDALLNRARLLELTFRDEEALAIYDKVLAERPAPRSLIASNEDEDEDEPDLLGGGIRGFVKNQIRQQRDVLSLYTTARLRAERLKASSTILTPPPENP